MLIIALIHTGIQLVCAIWSVYRKGFPVLFAIVSASFLLLACVAMLIPPIFLGPLLLGEIYLFRPAGRRVYFIPVALATVLSVYGPIAAIYWNRIETWKSEYPMESMVERVPEPKPVLRHQNLSDDSLARLSEWESEYSSRGQRRSIILERLHDNTVQTFVNSPGFGVGRIIFMPSDSALKSENDPDIVVPQPGFRSPLLEIPDKLDFRVDQLGTMDGSSLHDQSLHGFLNPRGFGYARNRRAVAGFQPHQFGELPTPREKWKLRSIELVSLLLHEPPAVYVTANLPKMSELGHAPTRPLDKFEERGLAELLRGEELYIRDIDGTCFMLGAIRAVKQCQTCHGCERGDLLGAFSYSMYRENAGKP